MKPDFFKYLPPEIMSNILLKLSVRTIAVSKCVCKSWLHLLETDDFIASHFAQSAPALALAMLTRYSNWFTLYELEEDELDLDLDSHGYDPLTCFPFPHIASICGSANGLLFLFDIDSDRGYTSFYVCNPITREFIELRCGTAARFGFGASKLGQHKVVYVNRSCVQRGGTLDRRFECYVYTLGTGSWRLVEDTVSFDWSPTKVGAFVRGNLHWMVSSYADWIERISCFDLETERFSSFALPPLGGYRVHRRLYTQRDSLAFCDESLDCCTVDLWMMKEYGVEKSWTKEYVICLNPLIEGDEFQLIQPIKVYENGDALLLVEKTFFHYSKKTKTSREIGGLFGAAEDFNYQDIFLSSLLHTPTMLSLKCFGRVENVVSF